NGDNIAWPSRKYMAKQAGCSVRSIASYTSELKRIGLIQIIRRGKKLSNQYLVNSDVQNTVCSDVQNTVCPKEDSIIKTLNSGIPKKELPPYEKMIKFYNEDDPGLVVNEDGSPIVEEIQEKGMASYRLDAENLLKYYNALYKKEIGTDVPYWPKGAYLKQVKPVLAKYSFEKLKKLMDAYFYRDDIITRDNKWSISCFLSFKMLPQLDD
ncbi:MAG: helix-turn-helix domain-containing protein, partial [Patescibacteria group bacterium]